MGYCVSKNAYYFNQAIQNASFIYSGGYLAMTEKYKNKNIFIKKYHWIYRKA
jgi:hypothetical protein